MINNVAIIEGNLGKDPEVKQLENGKSLCNFSLAVYRNKETTDWIDCVAFGAEADALKQAEKGRKVRVDGRLQQRTWEKDGKKNSKVEILANSVMVFKKFDKPGQQQDESTPF